MCRDTKGKAFIIKFSSVNILYIKTITIENIGIYKNKACPKPIKFKK